MWVLTRVVGSDVGQTLVGEGLKQVRGVIAHLARINDPRRGGMLELAGDKDSLLDTLTFGFIATAEDQHVDFGPVVGANRAVQQSRFVRRKLGYDLVVDVGMASAGVGRLIHREITFHRDHLSEDRLTIC